MFKFPKLKISSFHFNLLMVFIFFISNFLFFEKMYYVADSLFVYCAIVVIVLALLVAACNVLLFKFTTKFFAITFLLINSVVLYFMLSYNIAIDGDMLLNVLKTDPAEAKDIVTLRLFLYILFLGILPAFLIYKTKISYKSLKQELKIRIPLILICLMLVVVIMLPNAQYSIFFLRKKKPYKNYLMPANYVGAVIAVSKMINVQKHPLITIGEDASLNEYWDNGKKNLIVLVVGETASAENFSLGDYERDTNYPLDPYLNDLIYFDDVKSCGTSTAQSLPCMLSKYGKGDFKPGTEDYTENVLDVIQRAGYDVSWVSNNTGRCYGYCDRTATDFVYDARPDEKDIILLDNFDERVKASDKNRLIVLHQQGSHGPKYYKRYTKEFETFTPTCQTDLVNCTDEEIRNAYDNSIIYTSYFLGQTIDTLKSLSDEYNVAMIYVSDHGESLGKNGIYLHAMPYELAPIEQIHVPMLIWLNDENAENLKIDRNALEAKKSDPLSHDNLFHTLLSITGVETKEYKEELDLLR